MSVARAIINILEACYCKATGQEVVDYLLRIGTSHGGFLPRTLNDVAGRNFELKSIPIEDLLQSDPKFAEFYRSTKKPDPGKQYEPRDLRATDKGEPVEAEDQIDSPVVVIDGRLRDGWHRTAGKLDRGDTKVLAYVASQTAD